MHLILESTKSYDKCIDNSNNIYNFASQNRHAENTDIKNNKYII
ncbi:hypothetical protein EZS27_016526 [termite gut metagenome]|uniref:Uncharacterized protein n=1 Tax=termite gut metagenome TaxID=433724 RepID=A0A5J4RNP8_9ZZZZ